MMWQFIWHSMTAVVAAASGAVLHWLTIKKELANLRKMSSETSLNYQKLQINWTEQAKLLTDRFAEAEVIQDELRRECKEGNRDPERLLSIRKQIREFYSQHISPALWRCVEELENDDRPKNKIIKIKGTIFPAIKTVVETYELANYKYLLDLLPETSELFGIDGDATELVFSTVLESLPADEFRALRSQLDSYRSRIRPYYYASLQGTFEVSD